MSRLIPEPRLSHHDANGKPFPGALCATYLSQTSDPAPVFKDSALSVAHSNPVVADDLGRFPVMYGEAGVEYKFILTDADGGNARTIDPASPFLLTQSEIGDALYPQTNAESVAVVVPGNTAIYPPEHAAPRRYGAAADGITDDTASFAVLESAYEGVEVDLGGLTYKVTAIPSANIYKNGTFSISSDDAPLNTAYGWQAFRNNAFTPFEFPSSTLNFAGGNYNTAIGSFALNQNTHGRRNTGVGAEALRTNSTGFYNTAVGARAMSDNTVGAENTAVGVQCMQQNTTGDDNTAVGAAALNGNTTGDNNTGVGRQALLVNTTGTNNTGVGFQVLLAATTANNNTAVGYQACSASTTGDRNTAVGAAALGGITTGSQATAVGNRALLVNTANNNTAVGADALISNTSGTKNAAFGYSALAANITGVNNTAFGDASLILNTASNNAGFGTETLTSNTTGARNTALGYSSLSLNVTYDNTCGLGYNAQVTGSNQLQLGDSNTTSYAYGALQNRSDERDKADIRDSTLGLEFIQKLRPVDFRWDYREDYGWSTKNGTKKRTRFHHGLIAQEVKAAADALGVDFGGFQDHSIAGGKDVLSLGYEELIPVLINSIQQLAQRVTELERK
jgi:hypothetical protein